MLSPVVIHRTYVRSALEVAGVQIVPPGPSRVLTITAGGDPVTVDELVAPSIWLGVDSRPDGRLVLYGGVITGSTSPPTVVELQDHDAYGWRDFAAASVSTTGRFRVVYRAARSTVGYRFALRASTLQTSAWQPGASRVHLAVVR
ncbi:MAG: hypothetical protein ABSG43_00410 [Solirubrobacteraceae bacterium]|jgi:hypothetical protein